MQNTTGDVLYFFCKKTDEKWQKPYQVPRTIISQLLVRDDSLYPWFETLCQESGHNTAASLANLQDTFLLALKKPSKPLIYIVVDALDECQQSLILASSLTIASMISKKTVKLF
jgi:hypothetical protein